jgi:hypothetical protein
LAACADAEGREQVVARVADVAIEPPAPDDDGVRAAHRHVEVDLIDGAGPLTAEHLPGRRDQADPGFEGAIHPAGAERHGIPLICRKGPQVEVAEGDGAGMILPIGQ